MVLLSMSNLILSIEDRGGARSTSSLVEEKAAKSEKNIA